jgi:hypothetical protein
LSLEARFVLSGGPAVAAIVVESVSQPDAHDLSVDYRVQDGDFPLLPGATPGFSVYRSSDATLDSGDLLVAHFGGGTGTAGTDVTNQPLEIPLTPGAHTIDLPLPQALPINLARPYVIVAADTSGLGNSAPADASYASVRHHTLVVFTHGGLQSEPGNALPPWVVQLGKELKAQGFERVLTFNWVRDSWKPGRAATNGPKLADQIRKIVASFPAGEPVDLHLIGHSEGTVVDAVALRNLERRPAPNLAGGTIQVTMLDPHPARYGSKFPQYSVKPSFMGWGTRLATDWYQSLAKDPPPAITPNVDDAEVYYQHTYYAFAPNGTWPWENLWGEVPVPVLGNIQPRYVDITGVGISHAGNFSVVDWYQTFVLPTLGSDHPFEPTAILTAQPDLNTVKIIRMDPAIGQIPERVDAETTPVTPRFSGWTWPGGRVHLSAAPRGKSVGHPIVLGSAVADAQGHWQITVRKLPPGRYAVEASAVIPILPRHPRVKMTPRVRVGTLLVEQPQVFPDRQTRPSTG